MSTNAVGGAAALDIVLTPDMLQLQIVLAGTDTEAMRLVFSRLREPPPLPDPERLVTVAADLAARICKDEHVPATGPAESVIGRVLTLIETRNRARVQHARARLPETTSLPGHVREFIEYLVERAVKSCM